MMTGTCCNMLYNSHKIKLSSRNTTDKENKKTIYFMKQRVKKKRTTDSELYGKWKDTHFPPSKQLNCKIKHHGENEKWEKRRQRNIIKVEG